MTTDWTNVTEEELTAPRSRPASTPHDARDALVARVAGVALVLLLACAGMTLVANLAMAVLR